MITALPPRAALLIVGSEMLDLGRADANGPYARERLAEVGIPLALVARVEDRVEAIAAAFDAACASSEIVLLSGGLGPTGDDLTRQGVAAALRRDLVEDASWLAVLEERLRARGREMNAVSRLQAQIVAGGTPIPNARGLACGSLLELGSTIVALLPGVPGEFRPMLDGHVMPLLAERFPTRPTSLSLRATLCGISEAAVEPVLTPFYALRGVEVSVLPTSGVLSVTIRATSPPAAQPELVIEEARTALQRDLAGHLLSLDGEGLPDRLLGELEARSWSLAIAESCTGGRIAHRIVTVPGASRVLIGSLTAYANRIKEEWLEVPAATLATHGAVSEATARAMAEGARRRFGADCAIASTGIAGPDGATREKPQGLVFLAATTPSAVVVERFLFPFDRGTFIEIASNYGLYLLWRLLRS